MHSRARDALAHVIGDPRGYPGEGNAPAGALPNSVLTAPRAARYRMLDAVGDEVAAGGRLGKLPGVTGSTDGVAPADRGAQVWTTRALLARHRVLGIAAVVLLVLLVAIILGGILSSSTVVVNDSSTCATWSAAKQSEQLAYAQRYVRAHGALPGGAGDPASIVAAINAGCTQAFDNDAQEDVTVVQAIKQ